MEAETVLEHEPRPALAPEPGFRRCLVRTKLGRCYRQVRWLVTIECLVCRASGGGHICDFHLLQAKEWGVPHGIDGDRNRGDCPHMALLTSVEHI